MNSEATSSELITVVEVRPTVMDCSKVASCHFSRNLHKKFSYDNERLRVDYDILSNREYGTKNMNFTEELHPEVICMAVTEINLQRPIPMSKFKPKFDTMDLQ
ncbi:hypothetical protein RND81_14G252600 [Saponaria officinalis]|uniref:Uncharacterized protein n=1 Tax=Saponaria officinalis TaxID=3572 RepID=A0AAW1GUG8_SAPOF